ncbi:MAG: hypothetical protein JSV79_06300, partial [Armatimonadota bacterium]
LFWTTFGPTAALLSYSPHAALATVEVAFLNEEPLSFACEGAKGLREFGHRDLRACQRIARSQVDASARMRPLETSSAGGAGGPA